MRTNARITKAFTRLSDFTKIEKEIGYPIGSQFNI